MLLETGLFITLTSLRHSTSQRFPLFLMILVLFLLLVLILPSASELGSCSHDRNTRACFLWWTILRCLIKAMFCEMIFKSKDNGETDL